MACDPVQNLEVMNKSTDTIFFELSKNGRLEIFPIQKKENGDTLWSNMNYAFPNERSTMPLIGTDGWENFINKKCIDSTLSVFFFQKELLKNTSQDSLLSNQLYSKKAEFKVKDLERLNWQIKYEK